jgi:hypothetical protein
VAAWKAAANVEDGALRAAVRERIARLALDASGLLLEARAETAAVIPGASLPVKIHATLRGAVDGVKLESLQSQAKPAVLTTHERHEWSTTIAIAIDAPVSVLPWLAEPPEKGRYRGKGAPDSPLPPPPVAVSLALDLAGLPVALEVPVQQVWVDPVAGELRRDVEILPPITATPDGDAVMLPEGRSATLRVRIRLRGKGGIVRFQAPDGHRAEPAEIEVSADTEVTVKITSSGAAARATLRIVAQAGAFEGSFAEAEIDHPHLPRRTVLLPASVDLVPVVLAPSDAVLGYISGPGDRVAASLRRAGFDVREIDDATLADGDLDVHDAILVGIRAFNTNETLRKRAARLNEYAERGGTVVVQYTTKHRTEPLGVAIGPYDLEIGRGRVTDEDAAVTLLAPDHPILTTPHRIAPADFEDWVQERGLYFAESWGPEYKPLLSMADPKDEPEEGALLVADVGEGRFIYAGLSLFRQLPAGVPGAYRLIANMVARRGAPATAAVADEAPPLLGSWRNLYLMVGGALVLLIAAFYLITRHFRS